MNTTAGISPVEPATPLQEKRPRTLLLVDDEENILAALTRVLRREGYRILTANSGEAGLELLAVNLVDVIVSDQRMPGMTGVEFLRQAKAIYPDTVRIVLSGYTELQSITDAINEGAIYKFLTKPWDDNMIRANIAEAFRHKELGDDYQRLASQLARANQELQGLLVEKQRQIVLDEVSLNVAQEILYHMPLPIVGIDEAGMMVFSNPEADFVLGSGRTLLGEAAVDRLPSEFIAHLGAEEREDFLWYAPDGSHTVLCRRMGDRSQSRGYLVVVVPPGLGAGLLPAQAAIPPALT